MTNKPPADDQSCTFILCEDIREELNRKFIYSGVYPGEEIVALANKVPVEIPSLAFVFTFRTGEGKFKAKIEFVDPLGKNIISQDLDDAEKQPNLPMSLMLKISPVSLPVFGTYGAKAILDNQVYNRPVVVKKSS